MPSHSETAGSIILEEAFALAKMHDSTGWNGLLRSKITPADIDFPQVPLSFDNNGAVIFIDFSNSYDRWQDALRGQRWLYESLIKWGPHCAVLAKHGITPEARRKIDTLRDIETFHVMVWDFEPILSPLYDGAYWQNFVIAWVNDPAGPLRIRRTILGSSIGMIKPRPIATPPVESS